MNVIKFKKIITDIKFIIARADKKVTILTRYINSENLFIGDNMLRKLVTIRQITSLNPIPGADVIEVAGIEGWNVIVKKGEYCVGDFCMYFEIDSFLPESDSRYSFLMKAGTRKFEGVKGHKLRTIKLRGQLSQGFVLPLEQFPELTIPELEEKRKDLREFDFAEKLGIKKFELPIPAQLAGEVKGQFPSFIRKTDQERCQNLIEEIFELNKDSQYEVTTKLDGTSVTYYHHNKEFGACSRNLELEITDVNKENTIIKLLKESGLSDVGFDGYALQGELMGPSIQCNRERLKLHCLYIFDIKNLTSGEYLSPSERQAFMEQLYAKEDGKVNKDMVQHIPVLKRNVKLGQLGIETMADLLTFAEGKSITHEVREGVVFKQEDGPFSFKAMSNLFLAKEND